MRDILRISALGLLTTLWASTAAVAQSPPNPNALRSEVDYSYAQARATRHVHDALDRGKISLLTDIWRPLKNSRHEVVLFSHGSLGGLSINPAEPIELIPRPLLKFLIDRGYTVVLTRRRGIGGSTGHYSEECPYQAGKCTLQDYRTMTESSVDDAVADTSAVIDQVIEGREVEKGSKLIFAGISRGGFLSLRMAAQRPEITKAVVNFVGGWISVNAEWPPEENAARLELYRKLFGAMGVKSRAPTLWIYASRDPFYTEATSRGFLADYQRTGGQGRYVFVAEHALPIGHLVATQPALWASEADSFLASLDGKTAASAESPASAAVPAPPPKPSIALGNMLKNSKPEEWRKPDPANTLYMDLKSGRVIIELAPRFSPLHAANIRVLASKHYFDGLSIYRVQDNYVTQWGDADGKKPLPIAPKLAPEYTLSPANDLPFTKLPDGDIYAPEAGFVDGFPAARDPGTNTAWLVHCYGMVGAGRDLGDDSGPGSELYAINGSPTRHMDRNVALVGRVLKGMDLLSSLPRGFGDGLGMYEKVEQRVLIVSVRLAADVPEKERVPLEILKTDSATFHAIIEWRRHRQDDFYKVTAGHTEICSIPVPMRTPE